MVTTTNGLLKEKLIFSLHLHVSIVFTEPPFLNINSQFPQYRPSITSVHIHAHKDDLYQHQCLKPQVKVQRDSCTVP